MIGVPYEGAKRPSGGRVWEGGYGRDTSLPFEYQNLILEHLKNDFLGN